MRRCKTCSKSRALKDFYRVLPFKWRRHECKFCEKRKRTERLRDRKRKEPEYIRARTLRYKYGMTLEAFNKMLMSQNNRCKICKSSDHGKSTMQGFSVDHDHKTGKVRALLCHHCNAGLGF